MDSKIVFVEHGNSFMIDTVYRALINVHYTVTLVEPNISDLRYNIDGADIVLVYLGKFVYSDFGFLNVMRELCREKNVKLCVVGEQAEYEELLRYIPATDITLRMLRPINVPVLISSIQELLEDNALLTGKKNIAIVDDDSTYLKIATTWLTDSGKYQVTPLNSGTQALVYLMKHTPDLLLLDFEMPVMSGPQVMKRIRAREGSSKLPIMFLTGKNDKDSVSESLELKPDGYILKTGGKDLLLNRLESFFASRA